MSKNVMIPLSLMRRIIDLLGYLQTPHNELSYEHCDILDELMIKMKRVELRDAYAKIISAKNEDDRHDARIEYLQQKNILKDMELDFAEIPF
jgi:hypothetical protein